MTNPSMTGAQIFVIDSAPSNLVLVLSILRRAGYTNALPFTDAQTALDAAAHVYPDLVLLDLDMPGCNVAAFTNGLRTKAASAEVAPVLALGSNGTGEALTRTLSSGVSEYVPKPINDAEMMLRVRNLLLIRFGNGEPAQRLAEPDVPDAPPAHEPPAHEQATAHDNGNAIREVIERGGPDIVFQPIIELASGTTVRLEALARFGADAPSPARWFAHAAEVGLGVDLELAAIAAALGSLAGLNAAYRLAVNLSPATLLDDRFHALLSGRDLHRLAFELPEQQTISDRALRDATAQLRSEGALVCVDDARADYGSFRHILDLKPDVIKLDISLTRGIDTDPVKRMLATSLEHFAREIGATVTAEGIETQAELDVVRDLGIENGQGFHIARPAPLERADAPPAAAVDHRRALLEAIGLMLTRERRVTAFAIDLDHFAEVNAKFGTDVGDEVLRTVNARLQSTLRPGHIVAPVGGDAFVVVSDTVADELEALALAHRICDVFARRVGFAAIQVEVTASVGIAFATNADPAHLLADAEAALQLAKRSGPGSVQLHSDRSSQLPEPRCPA